MGEFRTKNFEISEFNTGNATLSEDVESKIIINFMNPLQNVRDAFGEPIYIRSGYRSEDYNKSIGGSSASQHLFKGEGASDISTTKSGVPVKDGDLDELLEALRDNANFRRLAVYDTFIHCDYKNPEYEDAYEVVYKVKDGKWFKYMVDGQIIES